MDYECPNCGAPVVIFPCWFCGYDPEEDDYGYDYEMLKKQAKKEAKHET